HRRRPAGIRAPRVAGRVPAGTTPRPADDRGPEPVTTETLASEADVEPTRTAPTRRRSRPRGVAAVVPARARRGHAGAMIALAGILLLVGIVLLLLGVFVATAKFLLWVGLVIVIIAIIVGLMRFIRRQV
ncbi:MAG: hypothetical protein J0I44_10545, partial [Microbacterium sp.]|nr:hypothetical protein [Microbacterium sp.]